MNMSPRLRTFFCVLFLSVGGMCGFAYTEAESNEVVRLMLRIATSVNDNLKGGRQPTLNSTSQDVFFGMINTGEGWTRESRRRAFDQFVSELGDIDYSSPTNLWRRYAGMAVAQCADMDYTDAQASIRRLALNETFPEHLRRHAIATAVQLGGVSRATTDFVDTVMTNSLVFGRRERSEASDQYAQLVKTTRSMTSNLDVCVACDQAVAMLYRNRMKDWENAFFLDELFASTIQNYSYSSNRLEFALNILSVSNCWAKTRSRFVTITNQLLSAGQPLQQLNLEGNEQ